jgi:excinuclease UvrABC nuclease subunit
MYYVYFWRDPRVDEIFYVGKGMKLRAWTKHHNLRCENRRQRILKVGFTNDDIVQIIHSDLCENEALQLEEKYISQYKIIEDGGVLFNYRKKGLQKGSWQKINNQEIERIIQMYRDGETMKRIGSIYNVHETTIRKYLLERKINLREQGYTVPHPKNWDLILKELKSGRSKSGVAKQYGFCWPTFQRLLSERPVS